MQELEGYGAGAGVVIGQAHVAGWHIPDQPRDKTPPENPHLEIAELASALDAASQELASMRQYLPANAPPEISAFLDAHILMIKDPALRDMAAHQIRQLNINADAALCQYRDQVVGAFDDIEDEYLRSKKGDVEQIIRQIRKHLPVNRKKGAGEPRDAELVDRILVAHDLSPADAVMFRNRGVIGFVTDLGGPVSHVAILANSLRIPAVVGLHGSINEIEHGDTVAIDADAGLVVVDPDEAMVKQIDERRREFKKRQASLASLTSLRPTTMDGHEIELMANVELPAEIAQAVDCGASGAGLYRTEFLFMNRGKPPDEHEQHEAYAHAARQLGQVAIRTLDLGADKQVDGVREQGQVPTNPALGLRAIRLCLHQPDLFRPQLRAILRASADGDVQCMIPMLSSVDELEVALEFIESVKLELVEDGIDFNPDMPVGAMIEVPAAAITADLFAKRLDFLSIGTNDLIQYTLAIDRIDDEVNYLYDPMHPSVLHLIRNTLAAAARAGIPVSMCGEMAGDTEYTRLLLGMGLRIFSVTPSVLPEVKKIVRSSSIKQLAPLAARISEKDARVDRRSLLERLNSCAMREETCDVAS